MQKKKANPNISTHTKKKESFLKKYWHIIVIIILLIFGMGQCTKSCGRKGKITNQNIEMSTKDSIIEANAKQIHDMESQINYLNSIIENEKSHTSNFASIAVGNQTELLKKIDELESKAKSLEKENKALEKENASLKKEIENLKKE